MAVTVADYISRAESQSRQRTQPKENLAASKKAIILVRAWAMKLGWSDWFSHACDYSIFMHWKSNERKCDVDSLPVDSPPWMKLLPFQSLWMLSHLSIKHSKMGYSLVTGTVKFHLSKQGCLTFLWRLPLIPNQKITRWWMKVIWPLSSFTHSHLEKCYSAH